MSNLIRAAQVAADVLVADGSHPLTGDWSAGGNEITNLGAPTAPSSAARLSDVTSMASGLFPHPPVSVTSVANVALAGTPIIDSYQVVAGDRVLLRGQTDPIENGPWVSAAGAWSRPTDFANGSSAQAAAFFVYHGDLFGGNTYAVNTPAPADIVGTNPLTLILVSEAPRVTGLVHVAALVAVLDGDQATASVLPADASPGGIPSMFVNGIRVFFGRVTVGVDAYASGDGGVTAREFNELEAGDLLYWNPTVAGFALAVTDVIDFLYSTST